MSLYYTHLKLYLNENLSSFKLQDSLIILTLVDFQFEYVWIILTEKRQIIVLNFLNYFLECFFLTEWNLNMFIFNHTYGYIFMKSLCKNASDLIYIEQGVHILFPSKWSSVADTLCSSISSREWICPKGVESNVQNKWCEFSLFI